MSSPVTSLFNLLPAVYRLRDSQIAQSRTLLSAAEAAELAILLGKAAPLSTFDQERLDLLQVKAARGPLESMLMVVDEQLAILADNLDQLYDDQFIETCAPWVIPYIGDLIGYQSIHGIPAAVASPRAEVAHTISFRRRKGTVLVMEQLARDVTGWGAHAVEFFLRLADTQYMNHIRPHNHYSPGLHGWVPREYMNTGFDATAHTVDVRRVGSGRGRYNIQNIGIFLWSLNSYSVTHAPVVAVAGNPQCFRISTLGRDISLFNLPVSQGADITDASTPVNVPGPLSRHVLCRDIRHITSKKEPPVYYGEGLSLAIYEDGVIVDPKNIEVCNLSGADGAWVNLPTTAGVIAVDPELGRIAVPPLAAGGHQPKITATSEYGFNADIGGGEYSRAASTPSPTLAVAHVPGDFSTVGAALTALAGDGVVEITDSAVYDEGALAISINDHGHITLLAADGTRPTLLLNGGITVTGGADALFEINGFVIGYQAGAAGALPPALLHIPAAAANQLATVTVTDTTLVPGWALLPDGSADPAFAGLPTLWVEQPDVSLIVNNSIVGGLLINGESTATLTNSIVDAADPEGVAYAASIDPVSHRPAAGGALTLDGCTVIGKVHASLLSLVSNSIVWAWLSAADQAGTPPLWNAALWASRRQQGCVRFSYLPEASVVPRQFECVERARGIPQPVFYSLRYGDPGYAKLRAATDDSIRRGSDQGSEMGVFCFLFAPQRESDLRTRMQEYLPVGMEFGVFYQN
ncbi:MAG TPA: hypothetical protein VGD59_12750 [Acidisarcina sp.]